MSTGFTLIKMGNQFPLPTKCSNNHAEDPTCATQVEFEHEINENNPTELDTVLCSENKDENNDVDDKTCLKELNEVYKDICKHNIQVDAGPCEMDVDIECINLNDLDAALDLNELNMDSFESFLKNEDGIDEAEQNNNLLNTENKNISKINANDFHDNCSNVDVWKSIYEDFSAKISSLSESEDLKSITLNSTKNVLVELSEVNGDQISCSHNSSNTQSTLEAVNVKESYLDTEIYKNTSTDRFNSRKMSKNNIRCNDYALNIESHENITLRKFRKNKYNCNQEASNGRNETNSTTVNKITNKVGISEIIVISDDEDALKTFKSDVTEFVKHIDNEVIEVSDDEDPLEINENVSKNLETIISNKFLNELQTQIYSKEELVANYSECLNPITTDDKISKNGDLQSNSEYVLSFKKPNTEESPKQVFEYNNTECFKEGLLLNNSECVKPIDTIDLPTQDLQSKNDVNVPAKDAEEVSNQAPKLKSKECLNELTKIDETEFTNTTLFLDDDCDGYHSSDFEFIDEDEAKKWPKFLLTVDEAVEKNTVNSSHKFKKPHKINVHKRASVIKKRAAKKKRGSNSNISETFFENAHSENPITINESNTEKVLDENKDLKDGVMNLCREENEMLCNYLQSLQAPVNKQFHEDYRHTHRIPNDEEYHHLFGGIYSPYPMSAYGANKEVNVTVACQQVNFDVNNFVDDSTPEHRQEAKDTEMKMLIKYSIENRRRRSRRLADQ